MNGSTPNTKAKGRRELVEAIVAETVAVGYGKTTIQGIVRRSGTSRSDFYDHFGSKQAAVEAAYGDLFERYAERLLETCEMQSSWPLKVKVGIGVTLDMASGSPEAAKFLTVSSLTVGDDLLQQVHDSRERLARLLVAGRAETPHGPELPGVAEPVLVHGIAGVISRQLRAGEAKSLPAIAPQLTEFILTPYLGRDRASEVARRPRPAACSSVRGQREAVAARMRECRAEIVHDVLTRAEALLEHRSRPRPAVP